MLENEREWPKSFCYNAHFQPRVESEAVTMKSLGYNETTYRDLLFKIAFSYAIHYAKII